MNTIRGWALAAAVATALSACGGSGGNDSTGGQASPLKAGELDARFGNGGIAAVPASSNANITTRGNAGTQGADQRIWVVGAQQDYSNPRFLLSSASMARFRADGSVDATLQFTGPVAAGANVGIYSASAGMVVAYQTGSTCVGSTCLDWTAGLASMGDNGAPNGAFATSVQAFQPVQVFADGTGGSFMRGTPGMGGPPLTRIDAGGREDTLYAANASAASRCEGVAPTAIAPAGNGRLLVATFTPSSRTCITRLNADGTLDTTFGNAGHSIRDEAFAAVPRFIVVAPDQAILVVSGTFAEMGTWLQRFSGDGLPLDASHVPVETIIDARAASVQPDGRLLVAGYSHYSATGGYDQPVLVRLDKAGKRDAAFGMGGVASLTTVAGALQPSQVFVGVDARIYVVGSLARDASAPWRTQMAVARFGA